MEKELKRRINKMMNELQAMKELIDSDALQEKQKEQNSNIELIQKSWYMEGYHDREFNNEPKWIIKTGEGGPRYEENPKYGQHIEEKPAEWSEDFDKEVENVHKRYPEVSYAKLTRIAYHFSKWANRYKDIEWSYEDEKQILQIERIVESSGCSNKLQEKIHNWFESLRPSWKPSEDEERLINTSISFLKDFADKGYENAVECIDWLKSKSNGNSCK